MPEPRREPVCDKPGCGKPAINRDDGVLRMRAERAAVVEASATFCPRCMVPFGEYGCSHGAVGPGAGVSTPGSSKAGLQTQTPVALESRVDPASGRATPGSGLSVGFYAAPWNEPDGRKTWCVRRFVYGPDVYERCVVSWHETREQAQQEVELLYGR